MVKRTPTVTWLNLFSSCQTVRHSANSHVMEKMETTELPCSQAAAMRTSLVKPETKTPIH